MLKRIQPRIVWSHGVTFKYGEVIGQLDVVILDFQYNISFMKSGWVKYLTATGSQLLDSLYLGIERGYIAL